MFRGRRIRRAIQSLTLPTARLEQHRQHRQFHASPLVRMTTMQTMEQSPFPTAINTDQSMLSLHALASRWERSVFLIDLSNAVGLGPKFIKCAGALRYTVSEVQKHELARLMYLSQSRGLHYAVSLIFKTMQYWSKLFGQLVTPKEI